MQQAHGKPHGTRILGVEDKDLQLLVEREEQRRAERSDEGDELHIGFEHVRRLPENVRFKPRL